MIDLAPPLDAQPAADPAEAIIVDLRRQACSWDIVGHIAAGLLCLGVDRADVLFIPSKDASGLKRMRHMAPEARRILFERVMLPVPSLFGCFAVRARTRRHAAKRIARAPGIYPEGYSLRNRWYNYQFGPLVEAWGVARRLPPLRSSKRARRAIAERFGAGYVTVTLRKAQHIVDHNSDIPTWAAFVRWLAERHRVVLVPDGFDPRPMDGFPGAAWCCEAATDVHMRLALYRAAAMNMGPTFGPLSLAIATTEIPYLVFMPPMKHSTGQLSRNGIEIGGQFPWAGERQRLAWGINQHEAMAEVFADLMSPRIAAGPSVPVEAI